MTRLHHAVATAVAWILGVVGIGGLAPVATTLAQSNAAHPGQAPYDRVCKTCHGAEGQGNAGPAVVPFEMDVEQLLARVRDGGGEMPPFSANRVSDAEVEQIALYLKSLTQP